MVDKFKPLSEDELNAFLLEAQDDSDVEVERQQFLEATAEGAIKPKPVDKSQFKFNSSWGRNITIEEQRENQRNMIACRLLLKENRRKRVLAIKREHVQNGTLQELYEPLVPGLLKTLITEITEETRSKMMKQKVALTKKLEANLRAHMPSIVKAVHLKYPHVLKMCQGFDYVVSEHYGGHRLFVLPDIPDYFTDYMPIITEKLQEHIFQYDKNVEKYYELSRQLIHEETRYAFKFSQYKNRLDFLETDVDNYEKYIELYELSKLQ